MFWVDPTWVDVVLIWAVNAVLIAALAWAVQWQ